MGCGDHNFDASNLADYEFALGDELRGERATLGKSLLDVQRDLRIQANYIAAIEDCDLDVFPNKAFIPGYIRSYSRYLSLNPDEVFARFCNESGFQPKAASKSTINSRVGASVSAEASGSFTPSFPSAMQSGSRFADLPVSAVGSLFVLLILLGGLGYGGWSVLQNIQRVQFAPIEQRPVVVVEIDTLTPPSSTIDPQGGLDELTRPVSSADLVELYRNQELEVPILMPRDGPIASLDPKAVARLSSVVATRVDRLIETTASADVIGPRPVDSPIDASEYISVAIAETQDADVTYDNSVSVVAERAAWIRIYQKNGTVIFEEILGAGEEYRVPLTAQPPMIWAGNSGSVYLGIGEALHGPIGSGTKAVRDVVLDAKTIVEEFAYVSEPPSLLSQTLNSTNPIASEVAIQ